MGEGYLGKPRATMARSLPHRTWGMTVTEAGGPALLLPQPQYASRCFGSLPFCQLPLSLREPSPHLSVYSKAPGHR